MDKTALVTGCTSGIGRATALGLAGKGYNLILVARNAEKLDEVEQELHVLNPEISIRKYVCDLANLAWVVDIAKKIEAEQSRLDVLINNAGVWETAERFNTDGFEITWTVNYFAPVILTFYLLPRMRRTAAKTKDVRILNVSSEAHRSAKLVPEKLFEFDARRTYGETKLAEIMYTAVLARQLAGTGVNAYSLHPGVVATNIMHGFGSGLGIGLLTPEEGAQTSIYLATTQDVLVNGGYYDNKQLTKPSKEAQDQFQQEMLYRLTTEKISRYLQKPVFTETL